MALQGGDGFDAYNGLSATTGVQSRWTLITTTFVTMATGRFGGQCINLNTGGGSGPYNMARSIPTLTTNITVGTAMRFPLGFSGMASTGAHILLESAGVTQCGIRVAADGSIQAGRYSSTSAFTSLGTSAAGVIVSGRWHYVEMEVVIGTGTSGRLTVFVDGVQVINATSVNTQNAGNANVTLIRMGWSHNLSIGQNVSFDDFYWSSASTRLGELRVQTLRPSADVSVAFTPSSGVNNFSRVNETLVDGDTTFVQGSTVGDRDLYNFDDVPITTVTVHGVQPFAFARKTDAGTRSFALSMKSNTTDQDGADQSLQSAFAHFSRMTVQDPHTSAAWTATNVNTLQAGPKVTV